MTLGHGWTFLVWSRGVAYFRVCGYGLWWASYRLHPPLFSERNGYWRTLPIFGGRLRILKREREALKPASGAAKGER